MFERERERERERIQEGEQTAKNEKALWRMDNKEREMLIRNDLITIRGTLCKICPGSR